MKCLNWFPIVVTLGMITTPISVSATDYTFTTLDAPACGRVGTELLGINNEGYIVGGCSYSFIYFNGTFTPLDFPLSPAGGATGGINDVGQIVGLFSNSTGTHGFLDTNGNFTTIDDPDATVTTFGTTATEAYGINNKGQIVGIYLGPGYWKSFLYTAGRFTTLADPVAVFNPGPPDSGGIPFSGGGTFATGINNSGQTVGYYFDSAGAFNGFVYTNGSFTTIDEPSAPGGTFGSGTIAFGINDWGEIVGAYYDVAGARHGFLYINGTFTTIDYPGSNYTTLNGINNARQIVGSFVDNANVAHGFLAEHVQSFAGTPGKANCHGKSVSALAQQYGGLNGAAATLGFPGVPALQAAILTFCGG